MAGFTQLLRQNRNYRYSWLGQIVSEIGDHFNTIAVFSLVLHNSQSGLVVSGVMIARALPMLIAGPVAGVLLDRIDRKSLMIASDLYRAAVGLCFLLALGADRTWLLFVLSALLMFGSPFFTSGRAAILPAITTADELHTANSLTKTTQWLAVTLGALAGGMSVAEFGYAWAFVFNAFSFVFSAYCIWKLQAPKGFKAERRAITESTVLRPWGEYTDGLRYMRSVPLIFTITLVAVGWASGGGAAQILFTLFGEVVYPFGAAGLGYIWGVAGVGLLIGGAYSNWHGSRLSFEGYKRVLTISYFVHGLAYIAFSQAEPFWLVLVFIAISRAGMGVSGVLNTTILLRTVPDEFRGRVFATFETLVWGVMMLSMGVTGLATDYFETRSVAAVAGVLSCSTGVIWVMAGWKGYLVEPEPLGVDKDEVEVHGEPGI